MTWKDGLEFFLRLNELGLKQHQIEQQQINANQTTGINQQIMQSIIASEKQTIEVIKLTRIIVILTIVLILIGIIQLIISVIGTNVISLFSP
jgi:hypothetical protein